MIIGSGATAVTLVPAIAEIAAQVTMLQRSPSFIMPLPTRDPLADLLRKVLPERAGLRGRAMEERAGRDGPVRAVPQVPGADAAMLRQAAVKRLPAGYDVDKHFKPAYEPWDQRLCLVPDGDFFAAIKSGKAEVVTDHIEAFTPGLRLRSGAELEADVIVTATGLNLLPLGGSS